MADVVIFLTSGSSWVVPEDWNSSNNSIECIGGGGNGANGGGINGGRSGGGGGSYAKKSNVSYTVGASINYAVSPGGNDSLQTWFGGTSEANADAAAFSGTNAVGTTAGSGGDSASNIGDVVFRGGNGRAASGNDSPSGAGGGAAGPLGAGSNPAGGLNTTGGAANNSTVAGGASSSNGNSGTSWTSNPGGLTAGSGSGAGARSNINGNGFNGGSYGGAGSGARNAGTTGGLGTQGIIVITYNSLRRALNQIPQPYPYRRTVTSYGNV